MVIVEFIEYPYVDTEYVVDHLVNSFGVIAIPGTTEPLTCYVCNHPIVYIDKTRSPLFHEDGTPRRRTSRQPVVRLLANHCFVLQHINCSCPGQIYDDGDSSDSDDEDDPLQSPTLSDDDDGDDDDDDDADMDDADEYSSGVEATDIDEAAEDGEVVDADIGDLSMN